MGRHRGLSNGHNGFRVQPRTVAALYLHRPARGQHRPGPPHAACHPGLAAFRTGTRRLRPQQGSGEDDRAADDVALADRRRSLDVLRHDPDGVAAGATEAALPAVVGDRHQHRLHVVFHPSVRRRSGAVAARSRRMEGVRPLVRRTVLYGADHLRPAPRRTAVGRRAVYGRRSRRRSVGSALHVPTGPRVPDGGLLGAMQTTQDGANAGSSGSSAAGWGS